MSWRSFDRDGTPPRRPSVGPAPPPRNPDDIWGGEGTGGAALRPPRGFDAPTEYRDPDDLWGGEGIGDGRAVPSIPTGTTSNGPSLDDPWDNPCSDVPGRGKTLERPEAAIDELLAGLSPDVPSRYPPMEPTSTRREPVTDPRAADEDGATDETNSDRTLEASTATDDGGSVAVYSNGDGTYTVERTDSEGNTVATNVDADGWADSGFDAGSAADTVAQLADPTSRRPLTPSESEPSVGDSLELGTSPSGAGEGGGRGPHAATDDVPVRASAPGAGSSPSGGTKAPTNGGSKKPPRQPPSPGQQGAEHGPPFAWDPPPIEYRPGVEFPPIRLWPLPKRPPPAPRPKRPPVKPPRPSTPPKRPDPKPKPPLTPDQPAARPPPADVPSTAPVTPSATKQPLTPQQAEAERRRKVREARERRFEAAPDEDQIYLMAKLAAASLRSEEYARALQEAVYRKRKLQIPLKQLRRALDVAATAVEAYEVRDKTGKRADNSRVLGWVVRGTEEVYVDIPNIEIAGERRGYGTLLQLYETFVHEGTHIALDDFLPPGPEHGKDHHEVYDVLKGVLLETLQKRLREERLK